MCTCVCVCCTGTGQPAIKVTPSPFDFTKPLFGQRCAVAVYAQYVQSVTMMYNATRNNRRGCYVNCSVVERRRRGGRGNKNKYNRGNRIGTRARAEERTQIWGGGRGISGGAQWIKADADRRWGAC